MTPVQFIGHSVFQQPNGVRDYLEADCEALGVKAIVSAFGGHHIMTIRHLIESLLDEGGTTSVILDLASPNIRPHLDELLFREHLVEIINELARRRLRGGIVLFPRQDIALDNDVLADLFKDLAGRADLKVLDLRFLAARTELFFDDVHTNAMGGALFSKQLAAFALEVIDGTPVQSVADSGLPYRASAYQFGREGIVLRPGETMEVTLPPRTEVHQILAISGPKAGYLQVSSDVGDQRICCVDQHSYYERLGFLWLDTAVRGVITIRQEPGIPDVALEKGSFAPGERVGVVKYLLTREYAQ